MELFTSTQLNQSIDQNTVDIDEVYGRVLSMVAQHIKCIMYLSGHTILKIIKKHQNKPNVHL